MIGALIWVVAMQGTDFSVWEVNSVGLGDRLEKNKKEKKVSGVPRKF